MSPFKQKSYPRPRGYQQTLSKDSKELKEKIKAIWSLPQVSMNETSIGYKCYFHKHAKQFKFSCNWYEDGVWGRVYKIKI